MMNFTPRNRRNNDDEVPAGFQQMHDSIESLHFLDLEGLQDYAPGGKKHSAKSANNTEATTLKQKFNSLSLSPRRKGGEKRLSKMLSTTNIASPSKKLNPHSVDGSALDKVTPKKTRRGGKRNADDSTDNNTPADDTNNNSAKEANNSEKRSNTPFRRRSQSPQAPADAPKTPRTRSKMMAALRRNNLSDDNAPAGFQQMHDSIESLDLTDLKELDRSAQKPAVSDNTEEDVKKSSTRKGLFSPRKQSADDKLDERMKSPSKRSITPFRSRSSKSANDEQQQPKTPKTPKSKLAAGLRSITPFRGRQSKDNNSTKDEKQQQNRPTTPSKNPSARRMSSRSKTPKQERQSSGSADLVLPNLPSLDISKTSSPKTPPKQQRASPMARKQASEGSVSSTGKLKSRPKTPMRREQSERTPAIPSRRSKSSVGGKEQSRNTDHRVRRSRSSEQVPDPSQRHSRNSVRKSKGGMDGSSHSKNQSLDRSTRGRSRSARRSTTPGRTRGSDASPSSPGPMKGTADKLKTRRANTPARSRPVPVKVPQKPQDDDDASSTSSSTTSSSSSDYGSVGSKKSQAFVQLSLGPSRDSPTIKVRGAPNADNTEVSKAFAAMPAHQRPRLFNDMSWIQDAHCSGTSSPLLRSVSAGRGLGSPQRLDDDMSSPCRQSLSGSASLHTRSRSTGRGLSGAAAIHAAATLTPVTPRSRRSMSRRLGDDDQSLLSRRSSHTRASTTTANSSRVGGGGAASARRAAAAQAAPIPAVSVGSNHRAASSETARPLAMQQTLSIGAL